MKEFLKTNRQRLYEIALIDFLLGPIPETIATAIQDSVNILRQRLGAVNVWNDWNV
jgi:hypothetical protein